MEYYAVIESNELVLYLLHWRHFHDAFWSEKDKVQKDYGYDLNYYKSNSKIYGYVHVVSYTLYTLMF